MPQRLVTNQDLIDNPELAKQGVSVNQNYDFPEPANPAPDASEISEKHIKKSGAKIVEGESPKTIDPKKDKEEKKK